QRRGFPENFSGRHALELEPEGSINRIPGVTILLPWVPWNAERSTAPFLCASLGEFQKRAVFQLGDQFARIVRLDGVLAFVDAPSRSAIATDWTFVVEIFASMRGEIREARRPRYRPI